ncbi:daunorubicin/doxorubicin resistance ABC transporter ATP-binding protein DrrA, partial [Kitasatospora sp. NPDC058263]
VPVSGGARVLADAIRELDARSIEIDDIGLRRPTLDDVFLSLTGHVTAAEDEEGGAAGKGRGKGHGGHGGGRAGEDGQDPDQQAVPAGKER